MRWVKELIPRFAIEAVAGSECPEYGFIPECALEYWDFDKFGEPECVVRVRAFSWLWFSIPYGMGELYEWSDYKKEFPPCH